MSKTDTKLRQLGCSAQRQRLQGKGADGKNAEGYTYTYQGRRNGHHWVRRNDGKTFTGRLITNGAIALNQRVRYHDGQIDAMGHLPRQPQRDSPTPSTPTFKGELIVIFIDPDSPNSDA